MPMNHLHLLPRGALSSRLIPAIIATMVLLLTLGATAAIGLEVSLSSFQAELAGRYTVELPAAEAGGVDEEKVADVVDLLAETQGVIAAEVVPAPTIHRLLEPWLGGEAAVGDLPVPVLIDIVANPGTTLNVDDLTTRIDALVKGAKVEAAVQSMAEIGALAHAIELVAYAVVALIAACLAAVIVFATRSGLAAHFHIIEIVHQIGAREAAIAREFEAHFFILGLVGGVIGVALAGLLVFGLMQFAGTLDSPFLPTLNDLGAALVPLAIIPFAVAALVTVTAGITVGRSLRRLA